jgi:hypothetical protein
MSQQIVIAGSLDVTQNYTYDELNRLWTAAEVNTASAAEQWHQNYDYDRWGNRAVRNGSLIPTPGLTPISNSPSDLATLFDQSNNKIAMANFGYDDAGNLKQDPVTGPNPPNGMVYDGENRMTSYTKLGVLTEYIYDGDGHRVKKVDHNGIGIPMPSTIPWCMWIRPESSVVYDGENRMTSYTKLGVLTEYIYDGDGHRVKKVDHNGIGIPMPSTIPWCMWIRPESSGSTTAGTSTSNMQGSHPTTTGHIGRASATRYTTMGLASTPL